MKEKIGQHSIVAALKLGIVFILALFAVYTFQWFTGGTDATLSPFQKDSLTVFVENKEFQIPTNQLLESYGTNKESQSFLEGFITWIGITSKNTKDSRLDTIYIESKIAVWESQLNLPLLSEGGAIIEKNGIVSITEPRPGMSIYRDQIFSAIIRQARKPEQYRSYEIHARIKKQQPHTKLEDLEQIKTSLEYVFSNNLTLINNEYEISYSLTPEKIIASTEIAFNPDNKKHEVQFDAILLEETLLPFTSEAQNAQFEEQDDYSVNIVPSRKGLSLDAEKTTNNVELSLIQGNLEAEISFLPPTIPEFTTEDAEALGVKHLVSSFTTFYSCCEARSRNIQTFADRINNAVVFPGEEFNINTYVGQRTEEKGFEPAGTLVKGVLIETTGGGISQFATTFYNAVFWGGYQDIYHKPHSRYFTRYPEGIEATISWPEPNLIFKNDTDSGVVIKTSYTNTSITVSFYGDNDGRVVVGDHRYGGTVVQTKREGGEYARVVTSEVSEREELHDPQEVYYVDTNLQPNAIYAKTEGRPNYKVEVKRLIHQGGELIKNNTWTVRYLSEDAEFLVQDCQYAPEFSICKTQEDIEKEKEELLEFYEKLENGNT